MRDVNSNHQHGLKTPLVSVVIPCYNQAHFLGEAIESVLKQTYKHFEIVVVDDGSTDNTSEVARRYSGIRCIEQANQGLSAARNTGIRESKGEYLVFLDADDRLRPIALEAGLLDATEDEIIASAKQADAHEFVIQLPQGYNTRLGDRGVRLSGGQRQRISLARAIVRNPEILVLDEATNAVDSISEHLIQEALDTLSENRTVIVIAHRLSTIERADHIIVLEEGRVHEQGDLEHLLKVDGLFARLYKLQYRRTLIYQSQL